MRPRQPRAVHRRAGARERWCQGGRARDGRGRRPLRDQRAGIAIGDVVRGVLAHKAEEEGIAIIEQARGLCIHPLLCSAPEPGPRRATAPAPALACLNGSPRRAGAAPAPRLAAPHLTAPRRAAAAADRRPRRPRQLRRDPRRHLHLPRGGDRGKTEEEPRRRAWRTRRTSSLHGQLARARWRRPTGRRSSQTRRPTACSVRCPAAPPPPPPRAHLSPSAGPRGLPPPPPPQCARAPRHPHHRGQRGRDDRRGRARWSTARAPRTSACRTMSEAFKEAAMATTTSPSTFRRVVGPKEGGVQGRRRGMML